MSGSDFCDYKHLKVSLRKLPSNRDFLSHLQNSLDFYFFLGHGGTSVERSFFIKDLLLKQESFY